MEAEELTVLREVGTRSSVAGFRTLPPEPHYSHSSGAYKTMLPRLQT